MKGLPPFVGGNEVIYPLTSRPAVRARDNPPLLALRAFLTRHRTCQAAYRGIVGPQPLDDLDPIPIRVAEEEAIAMWDRSRLLDGDSVGAKVFAGGGAVRNSQGKMTGTDRVRSFLEEQMKLLIA